MSAAQPSPHSVPSAEAPGSSGSPDSSGHSAPSGQDAPPLPRRVPGASPLGVGVPGLAVRQAIRADGPAIAALDYGNWSVLSEVSPRREKPNAMSTVFDERHHPQDYLVALLDGDLVGYIRLVAPTPLLSNAHVRQIQGLGVDPVARRQGVGAALVGAALERARELGARRITLRVLGHNAPARKLYEDHGFKVEGISPEEFYLDGHYVDDVLMGQSL